VSLTFTLCSLFSIYKLLFMYYPLEFTSAFIFQMPFSERLLSKFSGHPKGRPGTTPTVCIMSFCSKHAA
jgi:hypothetical protein